MLTSSRRLPNARNAVTITAPKGCSRVGPGSGVASQAVLQATYSGESARTSCRSSITTASSWSAFARAVATGEPFAAPGEDGVRSVAVISAIAESAATGRTVQVADA